MSAFASTAETLDLLRRLRDAVRAFAAREEQLQREQQTQEARLKQRCEAVFTQRTEKLQSEAAALENSLSEARTRLATRWDNRRARLTRTHRNALHHRLTRIEERENQRKFELQRELLTAQREREAGFKIASAAHAEFTAQLKTEQEPLAKLAERARIALRGYGSWSRLLADDRADGLPTAGDPHHSLELFRLKLSSATAELERVRSTGLPVMFSYVPVWLWCGAVLLLVGALASADFTGLGLKRLSLPVAGIAAGAGLALVALLHLIGRLAAGKSAKALALAITEARQLSADCEQQAKARRQAEEQRVEAEAGSSLGSAGKAC